MEKLASHRLDQPLPHSLVNKLAGWASVARQYPIFSGTWFVYRMRSFIVPFALLTLVVGLIAAVAPPRATVPGLYTSLAMFWVVVLLGLSMGRGLAVLVRRRQWTARREIAGVVGALLFGMLASLSLAPYTRTGEPPEGRVPTQLETERAREAGVVNLVLWGLALGWLGGAGDLVTYLRQRRMLRENELLGQVERYKDERNEVEMQLAILASQVEPHFLFNTLSGVRAAMLSDPARGVAMIDHLVDYLRATIPQLRADRAHAFVSLGSQLDAAQAYLGIIQARLPRLGFRIVCPDELRSVAIPPLMLISLVENAIKHGIELKKGPGMVDVTAKRKDAGGAGVLELAVADNGVGFGTVSSGSGIGLANIRERLTHLYGVDAALSLRAADEGGVVASIVLPIRAVPEMGV